MKSTSREVMDMLEILGGTSRCDADKDCGFPIFDEKPCPKCFQNINTQHLIQTIESALQDARKDEREKIAKSFEGQGSLDVHCLKGIEIADTIRKRG